MPVSMAGTKNWLNSLRVMSNVFVVVVVCLFVVVGCFFVLFCFVLPHKTAG